MNYPLCIYLKVHIYLKHLITWNFLKIITVAVNILQFKCLDIMFMCKDWKYVNVEDCYFIYVNILGATTGLCK